MQPVSQQTVPCAQNSFLQNPATHASVVQALTSPHTSAMSGLHAIFGWQL
jgi:hypothetical protein